MDKLEAMHTFVRIAEKGSLTQAAEALNTSLPSVVRTLAALEKYLGVRLMNRTTRKIALTDEGYRYLAQCKRVLSDIADVEQALVAGQAEPQGVLRITAPSLFGQMHVAPVAVEFYRRNPQVQIDLLLLDRVVNLVEEGIDVAIRLGTLEDSSLVAIPVGTVRRVVCASPEYLKKNGTPKHPDDLLNTRYVHVTGMSQGGHWTFREKTKTIKVPLVNTFTCNQAAVGIDACVNGVGYGMFMSYQVQSLVEKGKLKIVLEQYEPQADPVNVLFLHAKLVSARVRSFVDEITEQLRKKLKQ